MYLLEQGYAVTAVDAEQAAIQIVKDRVEQRNLAAFKGRDCLMEEVSLSEQFDLITSNLALPFVPPSHFSSVWSKIVQHLHFDGFFSGQFFGKEHQWSSDPNMSFHDAGELKALFNGLFTVVHFYEEKTPM